MSYENHDETFGPISSETLTSNALTPTPIGYLSQFSLFIVYMYICMCIVYISRRHKFFYKKKGFLEREGEKKGTKPRNGDGFFFKKKKGKKI